MDSIFLVEAARAAFLQNTLHSLGCTYICLWSYLPQPSNCLIFMDGLYNEESNVNQPSSSTGSLAQRLFDEYRRSVFTVQNDRVPGFAFKNNLPLMELKGLDLQGLASVEAQLQFYQEARIKTAIFMGCGSGEIELGMSSDPQVNLEMEMKNWFPEDFPQQAPPRELPIPTDQSRPSSSSSSMRSLSMDSPERSPFMFNIPNTTYLPEPATKESPMEQTLRPISTPFSPLHQAMQAFSQIRNLPFPTPEVEDAAMTKAILAVLSSPPPPPPSSLQLHQILPPSYPVSPKASAFKRYGSGLAPSTSMTSRVHRQNMVKRSIAFFRTLGLMRAQERVQGSSRPTNTQLHHMISERKRREKLNESFQALRSLLPPGTKKDKASVLTTTTEYITSLKTQIMELTRRNQRLEAQLLPKKEATEEVSVSSSERVCVDVTHVAESTSEARIIDLQVIVRGECNMLDFVIRLLEFLKQIQNVSLMNVEADTQFVESNSIDRAILRLKIEGSEWDESSFQEAVRRVVADLAR